MFLFFHLFFALLLRSTALMGDTEDKVKVRDVKIVCVDSGLCINCSKNELVSLINARLSLFLCYLTQPIILIGDN